MVEMKSTGGRDQGDLAKTVLDLAEKRAGFKVPNGNGQASTQPQPVEEAFQSQKGRPHRPGKKRRKKRRGLRLCPLLLWAHPPAA